MTSSHQPLKSRVFSEWSQKRTSEIWSMVGIGVPLLAWRWNEPRGKKRRQLLDAENGLPLTASKGRGLQSSNPKELKLANKNDHGNRFSSKSPDENSVQSMPWLQSCKSLGRESSHTTTDFWPMQPWANTWVSFHAAKFVIIHCATIENSTNRLKTGVWRK